MGAIVTVPRTTRRMSPEPIRRTPLRPENQAPHNHSLPGGGRISGNDAKKIGCGNCWHELPGSGGDSPPDDAPEGAVVLLEDPGKVEDEGGLKHSATSNGDGTFRSKNDHNPEQPGASADDAFKEYDDAIKERGRTPVYKVKVSECEEE